MKVKVTQYGIINSLAQCRNCQWDDYCKHSDMEALRRRIRKHVKDTGHKVLLDTTKSTEYEPQ